MSQPEYKPTDLAPSEDSPTGEVKPLHEASLSSSSSPTSASADADDVSRVESGGETGEPSKRSGIPPIVFAIVCLAFVCALGWQMHHAGQLEGRIARLEQDLREKNALLGAHRLHRDAVRGGVSALVGELAELQELVEKDPEWGVRAAPAADAVAAQPLAP